MKLSECPTWRKLSPAMQSIITAEAKRLKSSQAALWHIADNSAAPEYGENFFEDYALFGELYLEIDAIRAGQNPNAIEKPEPGKSPVKSEICKSCASRFAWAQTCAVFAGRDTAWEECKGREFTQSPDVAVCYAGLCGSCQSRATHYEFCNFYHGGLGISAEKCRGAKYQKIEKAR